MIKHSVKYGESVKSLANRYGVTIEEIQRWNGLDDDDSIYIGQKIMIPMNHYHPSRRDYFVAAFVKSGIVNGPYSYDDMRALIPDIPPLDSMRRKWTEYACRADAVRVLMKVDALISELDKDKK